MNYLKNCGCIALVLVFGQGCVYGQAISFDRDVMLLRWAELEEIELHGIIKQDCVIVGVGLNPVPYASGTNRIGTTGWVLEGLATEGNYFGVTGMNRRYGFHVSQSPTRALGKNENPLFVQKIADLHDSNSDAFKTFQMTSANLREKSELAFMVSIPWTKLLRSTGFHVDSSQIVSKDSTDAIQISFHCDPTEQEHKEKVPKVKNGVARFMSKQHFFVPIEWNGEVDFLFDDPIFYSVGCTYEYDLTRWKHPLITNWTMHRRWQNDSVVRTFSYESLGKSPPASAFTLSAYGLPEPPFVRSTAWWFYAVLTGALALVGLGLFIWNRSRKVPTVG